MGGDVSKVQQVNEATEKLMAEMHALEEKRRAKIAEQKRIAEAQVRESQEELARIASTLTERSVSMEYDGHDQRQQQMSSTTTSERTTTGSNNEEVTPTIGQMVIKESRNELERTARRLRASPSRARRPRRGKRKAHRAAAGRRGDHAMLPPRLDAAEASPSHGHGRGHGG